MKTISAEDLKRIADLANALPQDYREKCFELILAQALKTSGPDVDSEGNSAGPPTPNPLVATGKTFLLPIDVKAFLSQFSLDPTKLWKLFLADGEQICPIFHLTATKKATVQIQHALLMALESALTTGQFQVGIEALRTRCLEQKCYDSVNFMTILKNKHDLFKAVDKEQPLVLSPEGKSELADLIEELNIA